MTEEEAFWSGVCAGIAAEADRQRGVEAGDAASRAAIRGVLGHRNEWAWAAKASAALASAWGCRARQFRAWGAVALLALAACHPRPAAVVHAADAACEVLALPEPVCLVEHDVALVLAELLAAERERRPALLVVDGRRVQVSPGDISRVTYEARAGLARHGLRAVHP